MHVSEGKDLNGEHLNSTARWYFLPLLLFAIALSCQQRNGISFLLPMIGEELNLSIYSIGGALASLNLGSIAGLLLMAVFIWRGKSWLGYVVLGVLGVVGALLMGMASGAGSLTVGAGIMGLTYGGLLLGAYRMIGGWLSQKAHGLAIGLVFAVTRSMPMFTPLITAEAATRVGWRWNSRALAALWFVWMLLWI